MKYTSRLLLPTSVKKRPIDDVILNCGNESNSFQIITNATVTMEILVMPAPNRSDSVPYLAIAIWPIANNIMPPPLVTTCYLGD